MPEEDHNAFAAPSLDPLAFLFATFSSYIEDRQDVLTQLATATYPDGSVPEIADVVRTATFLFAAEDPALQATLRAGRQLIPDFLEEVLRLEGPVKTVSRPTRTRHHDIRISEAMHGPPDARRYTQEPTYVILGLRALHIGLHPHMTRTQQSGPLTRR